MKLSEMRALSITQPWAACMFTNGKNVENRSWNTQKRGFIAIHASSTKSMERFTNCKKNFGVSIDPESVDYGAIVGFARLVDVVTEETVSSKTRKWFEGDYGFVFADFIRLKEPVRVKGTLSFWRLKGRPLKACLQQLNREELKRLQQSEY